VGKVILEWVTLIKQQASDILRRATLVMVTLLTLPEGSTLRNAYVSEINFVFVLASFPDISAHGIPVRDRIHRLRAQDKFPSVKAPARDNEKEP
jgi:hypothetical protein